MTHYVSPEYHRSAFNCPLCIAYASQNWMYVRTPHGALVEGLEVAYCSHCQKRSIWFEGKLIYPYSSLAAPANPDLPADIKVDYQEARTILSFSTRGAAALLRLAIQKLCMYLGEKGENLNTDIGNLVKKGLPEKIQKSLDIVRVIGNNAVHPGQIDLKDDQEIATKLFDLVNLISHVMITQPKQIDELYGIIPETQKNQISKRDKP
jgi:hypothetical protein